jgi:hypothetical protein
MGFEMPLIRKLCTIGNGKAVFLPKSWIEYIEEKSGRRVEKVAIEVDETLKIAPILHGKTRKPKEK